MSIRQRAVSADQKSERRQDIVQSAWRMFQGADTAYDDVMIADIARNIHLAKGTVYQYFTTKEALYLAVLEQQLELWFDDLDAALARPRHTAKSLSRAIAASLADRPAMLRLLGMMHPALEPKSDYAAVLAMKRMLMCRLAQSGAALERALGLRAGDGAATLMRLCALVIGVQHLTAPSTVARDVIAREGLDFFNIDFARELEAMLLLLLTGAQHHST